MSACPAVPGKCGAQNKAAQEEAPLEWQPGPCYRFKAADSGTCHGLSQAGQLQPSWRSLNRM